MFIGFLETLLTIFGRSSITRRACLAPSPAHINHDNWCHQRVCDLTGQLSHIPPYITASGGYSDVWKCDLIKDGTVVKVAARTVRRQGGNNEDALRKALKRGKRELDIWMMLRHDHVLPLYGVVHDFLPGTTAMVCPWLENGTVTNFINSHHDLSRNHRLQLILDVAAGLRHLHSQSIVHGDLTGSNVLVCAQGRAYLADFGLSRLLKNHSAASHSVTGAARWAAPELFTDSLLSLQSDERPKLRVSRTVCDASSRGKG